MSYSENRREEEWTRRKSYLLRRLFEDEPMLSTISEGDESIAQYSPNISKKRYETQCPEDRPISPLPDLIIEIVPRRPKIYYDEPEEFYTSLEREMRRLYKRDYLQIYSTSSSDENIESLSNVDHNLEVNSEASSLEASVDGNNIYVGEEEYDERDPYEISNKTELHRLSQTITKTSIEESLSSNSIELQEDLETLILEKENGCNDTLYEDGSIESSESQNESSNSTLILSPGIEKVMEMSNEGESEVGEQEKSIKLAEDNGASSENTDSFSIPEPDIMRRRETRASFISLPNYYSDEKRIRDEICEFQRKSLSMVVDLDISNEIVASRKEMQVAEESHDITIINATSTPLSSHKSIVFRSASRKISTNRFEPYSPVPSRKLTFDQAQQTSFSDGDSDNQSLWRNFFVGIPKFFKLV